MSSVPFLSIEASLLALRQEAIIAYPTEAVYGLGCLCAETPTKRLLALKNRPLGQGLIIVVSELSQCQSWLALPKDFDTTTLTQPQPTTWVLPANAEAPTWLLGPKQTLAVRISSHPVIQKLTQGLNAPIVSTSANPAKEAPAQTPSEVLAYFKSDIAGITIGHLGGYDQPSKIRTLYGESLRS